MNAQTILLTAIQISATSTSEVENLELTISKLKEMLTVKGMPKRMIKRAIRIAEKKLNDF